MSASASKKKRKLLNEQGMNPRQVSEEARKKEKAKKLLPTLLFIGATVLALALILVLVFVSKHQKEKQQDEYYADHIGASTTVLAKAGDVDFTAAMYNYYYAYNASSNTTSLESLNHELGEVLNLYDAAVKDESFELSDEDEDYIDEIIESNRDAAEENGWPKLSYYLTAAFGEGCNEDNFREYWTIMRTAASYESKQREDFAPDAEELAAAYEEHADEYNLAVYDIYTVPEPETPEADETAEDAEAADEADAGENDEAADEADAGENDEADNEAEMIALAEAAMANFPEDDDNTVKNTSISQKNAESSYNEEAKAWLFDSARKDGDTQYFKLTSNDKTYYRVFRFHESTDNRYQPVVANVAYFMNLSTGSDESEAIDDAAAETETPESQLEKIVADATAEMTDEEFEALLSGTTMTVYSYSKEEYAKYGNSAAVSEYLYSAERKAGDTQYFDLGYGTYAVVRFKSVSDELYCDVLARNLLLNEMIESISHANELVINEDAYPLAKQVDASLYLPSEDETEGN